MLPTSEAVTQPHYIGHAGQAYNATTHFNPSTSVHSSAPPPPTSGTSSTQAGQCCSALRRKIVLKINAACSYERTVIA